MFVSTRILVVLSLAGMLAASSGCLTPVLLSSTSTPVEGRTYQVTGKTTGESCLQSILFIPFATDASLNTALENARKQVNADALIDVVVDTESLYTFFYNYTCTVVHATGVRFTGQPAPFLEPGPALPPVPAPAPAPPEATAAPAPVAAVSKPVGTVVPVEPAKPDTVKKETRRERKARLARERAEKKRLAAEKRKAEQEQKRLAEERKKAEAEAKKKAEEEKKKAALAQRRAEEEEKPIPDQYKVFCKYKPGDAVRVETKGQVVEGQFVKCVYFGVRIKKDDGQEGAVPFEQIWMVKNAPKAPVPPPETTPMQPAKPEETRGPAKPAMPKQPAKP